MQASFREKRITKRSRVFLGGEILVDSEPSAIECNVKNISHGGACIVVRSAVFLPNKFDLVVRKTNKRRHAVVTWKRDRQLGIAYCSA